MPFFLKSLFACLKYLLLVSLGIFILAGAMYLYYKKYPSYSSEGAGWGGVGDSLSLAVAVTIFSFTGILFWSAIVVRAMVIHKEKKYMLISHLSLLLFIYVILAAFFLPTFY